MTKSPNWSAEETAKLTELYSGMTNQELAKLFGRSRSAINTKGYKLGLVKTEATVSRAIRERYDGELESFNEIKVSDVPLDTAFKHREWLRIKYYEEELSLSDIADITGSTRKNIEYWMNKFKLHRRDNQERFTDRCLAKISETSKGRAPFSKGLTKYDHPSIMSISRNSSGELSHNWKGGIHINSSGYRFITQWDHPNANKDGYVLEHRVVMEGIIGRLLDSHEIVHHRDKDRLNNSPDNLYLFPSNKAHLNFHNYQTFKDADITEEKFMEEVFHHVYQ